MTKPKIENVRVEADDFRPAVLWTIGDRRFHVWLAAGDIPEDVVHSNPITPKNTRRDEHRSLDRTNKTQAAIWAEVWEAVERGNLLAQARADHAATLAQARRRTALRHEVSEIERFVIDQFRAGQYSEAVARELKKRYDDASAELASLGEGSSDAG